MFQQGVVRPEGQGQDPCRPANREGGQGAVQRLSPLRTPDAAAHAGKLQAAVVRLPEAGQPEIRAGNIRGRSNQEVVAGKQSHVVRHLL